MKQVSNRFLPGFFTLELGVKEGKLVHTKISFSSFSHEGKMLLHIVNCILYNNPSYSRILIGCHPLSIRGQIHDCRHHHKDFPSVF